MKKPNLAITLILALALAASGCSQANSQNAPAPAANDTIAAEQDASAYSEEGGDEAVPAPPGEGSAENAWDNLPESADIDSAPVEDLTDLKAVTAAYVWPLTVNGRIWSYSWSSPSEITADDLVYICAFNRFVAYDGENPIAPAEQVEAAIQKHFDVSREYLQTASTYQAEENAYWMPEGGGGWAAMAAAAEQQGDQIIIEIGVWEPDETTISEPIGALTVALENGTVVKYVSYHLYQ